MTVQDAKRGPTGGEKKGDEKRGGGGGGGGGGEGRESCNKRHSSTLLLPCRQGCQTARRKQEKVHKKSKIIFKALI